MNYNYVSWGLCPTLQSRQEVILVPGTLASGHSSVPFVRTPSPRRATSRLTSSDRTFSKLNNCSKAAHRRRRHAWISVPSMYWRFATKICDKVLCFVNQSIDTVWKQKSLR